MDFMIFFGFLKDFFWIYVIFSKLLRLQLEFTKVTTEHQKLPKMGQNSIISSFFLAQRANKSLVEGRSPPQELEVGPCSGLYLLVLLNTEYRIPDPPPNPHI